MTKCWLEAAAQVRIKERPLSEYGRWMHSQSIQPHFSRNTFAKNIEPAQHNDKKIDTNIDYKLTQIWATL